MFSLSDDKAISITRAQNNFIESAILEIYFWKK